MDRIPQTHEKTETRSPLETQVNNASGTKQEPSHHIDVEDKQEKKISATPQGSSKHGVTLRPLPQP
jgi:hypothetical protein